MPALVSWLRKKVQQVVDPERTQRVVDLKRHLHHDLALQKQAFSLTSFTALHSTKPGDLDAARDELYQEILARGWKDGVLTREERETATWVARVLGISPDDAQKLNLKLGLRVFERSLAKAMEDSHVDESEARMLAQIASGIGTDLPTLVQKYFLEQGEDFIRAVFLGAIQDGQLSAHDWQHLLSTTSRLGLTHDQMLSAIAPHAQRFVSHVLADAKADQMLSQAEGELLVWLLNNLQLDPNFVRNVEEEIFELKHISNAAAGRLPTITAPPNMELRAGEICHYVGTCEYSYIKRLKSGLRLDSHNGIVALTDNRLIFVSHTTSFSLRYRRVVSHSQSRDGIEIRSESKQGSGTYCFREHHRLAYVVLLTAIRRANQTIVDQSEGLPSRHIPRDVRQRVWQRYGGRCAECGADDYLEYDHIIPVAKGGSNADANVQVLCRRCNLKKSDTI